MFNFEPSNSESLQSTPEPQSVTPDQPRHDLEVEQKNEKDQLNREITKNKSETVNNSASSRADLISSIGASPAENSAPTESSPQSTPNQPDQKTDTASLGGSFQEISDKFKNIADKFKGIAAVFTAKFTDFFNKIFKINPSENPQASDQATEQPNPEPASTETSAPAKVESSSDWKELVTSEAKRLNIDPAFALAIMSVESGKKNFSDALNPIEGAGQPPVIRFEPHILNQQLAKSGNQTEPGKWGASKLVGRNVDGVSCEGGQANEIACLNKAISINREAAFNSISMGMGQIMGFNSKLSGYNSAEEMFKRFSSSEGGANAQILGMFKVIENSPVILKAAQSKNFSSFARFYNGASVGTEKHSQYMAALQNAYQSNGGNSNSALA
jgi:hypothetical protein